MAGRTTIYTFWGTDIMKQLLLCSLLSLATSVGTAHSANLSAGGSSAPTGKSLNWAERMFSQLEHDFGVVTKGADVRCRIEIRNQFGEPIKLHSVKTTCSCTTPTLSSNLLQPNEVGYLDLQLNTVKHTGKKSPNIDVVLSFGQSASVTVRIPIQAYIRGDVEADDLIDFGVVSAGKAQSKATSITYHGSAPWRITGVQENGLGVKVTVGNAVRNGRGLSYPLTVTLGSDLPVGKFERSVIVKTEEPTKSYVTLRVRATIEPKYVVASPNLNVGTVRPNSTVTKKVVIRSSAPFTIEALEASQGRTTADLSKMAPKTVHVLDVRVQAPEAPGQFTEELLFRIVGEKSPVSCVVSGVTAESRGAGSLTLSTVR